MQQVFLLLGGNIGDVEASFANTEKFLLEHKIEILKCSSIYRTKAWGKTDQPDFLNRVLLVTTTFDPFQLLKTLLSIETKLGRVRDKNAHWSERIIDIDILFFGNDILESPPELIIPHPFLHERRFTLTPLAEIAPQFVHPKLKKQLLTLLEECKDPLQVIKLA